MKKCGHLANRYLCTPESRILVVLPKGCRSDCGMRWLAGHQGRAFPPAFSPLQNSVYSTFFTQYSFIQLVPLCPTVAPLQVEITNFVSVIRCELYLVFSLVPDEKVIKFLHLWCVSSVCQFFLHCFNHNFNCVKTRAVILNTVGRDLIFFMRLQ